jgi:hypothetical protein
MTHSGDLILLEVAFIAGGGPKETCLALLKDLNGPIVSASEESSSARKRCGAGPYRCAPDDLRAALRSQAALRSGALNPLIIERDRRDEHPGRWVLHERSATDGEK